MKNTFRKTEYNKDFDHQSAVVEKFAALGFHGVKVKSCFANGASHYVSLNVRVVNPGNLPFEIFAFEGSAYLKVRISDHTSNLDRFGGVVGNDLSFGVFSRLAESGVIAANQTS